MLKPESQFDTIYIISALMPMLNTEMTNDSLYAITFVTLHHIQFQMLKCKRSNERRRLVDRMQQTRITKK
jgi:hypothetical protein